MRALAFVCCLAVAATAAAETVVDVSGVGATKFAVEMHVASPAFAQCLKKNLELSGLFLVAQKGSVRVSGAPGAIRAEGRGKVVSCTTPFSDDKSARMAARRLSDAMCEAFGQQKGFALDRMVFLNRGKARARGEALPSEICIGYPDGYDIRQLTSDGKMTVFPRWCADGESVMYISDKNGAPQIWEMNVATGRRSTKWSFRGSPAGIAVSPDGSRVAAILSFRAIPSCTCFRATGSFASRTRRTPARASPPGARTARRSPMSRTRRGIRRYTSSTWRRRRSAG